MLAKKGFTRGLLISVTSLIFGFLRHFNRKTFIGKLFSIIFHLVHDLLEINAQSAAAKRKGSNSRKRLQSKVLFIVHLFPIYKNIYLVCIEVVLLLAPSTISEAFKDHLSINMFLFDF